MKLRKVISILIAAVMVTVIMTVPSFAAKTNTGFIHASGGKLVDGNGEPYLIKGHEHEQRCMACSRRTARVLSS